MTGSSMWAWRCRSAGLAARLAAGLGIAGSLAVPPAVTLAEEGTRPVANGRPFVTTFDTLDPNEWYQADYQHPGRHFRATWSPDQITLEPGQLTLTLEPATDEGSRDFLSGELQRRGLYGYGRYEVVMKPAKVHGLISAFFVYTGRVFGTSHEEIDFEFLGRDTTQVYLNHFVDGVPQSKHFAPLGFDASESVNLYAFDWTPDALVWWVNGRVLLRAEAATMPIPRPPAKIYLSMLAGNERMARWSGVAADDARGVATYRCLSYRPIGDDGEACSDLFPELMTTLPADTERGQ